MRRVRNIILCSKNDKGKKDREIYETGRAEIITAKGDTWVGYDLMKMCQILFQILPKFTKWHQPIRCATPAVIHAVKNK